MELIFESKNYRIFSQVRIPTRKGHFIYFIKIGEDSQLFKIGTTGNLFRRMKEIGRQYRTDIFILWVSPPYKKSTTLAIEQKTIDRWRQQEGIVYIKNDRFFFSKEIKEVTIKVRKEYRISIWF